MNKLALKLLRFTVLFVLVLFMAVIFHEYGHMITSDALGYTATYEDFSTMSTAISREKMPETHSFLIALMGGIFSSFLLLLLSVSLFPRPESTYILIIAIYEYLTGIGEALWLEYYTLPAYFVSPIAVIVFAYRERKELLPLLRK